MGGGCSHSTDCITIAQGVTSGYRTKEPNRIRRTITSSSRKSYVAPYSHRLPWRRELSVALGRTKLHPYIRHTGLFLIPRVFFLRLKSTERKAVRACCRNTADSNPSDIRKGIFNL